MARIDGAIGERDYGTFRRGYVEVQVGQCWLQRLPVLLKIDGRKLVKQERVV